ncbi:CRISPR system Cascade subunit CasC [compost metagenome]
MTQRFLQLHLLTSYPGALLNRDDAGFAKRLPFGGTVRTRISSQCLKRHWRTHDGEYSLKGLGVDMAIRSRLTFQRYIYEPLLADGVPEALAQGITRELMAAVLGQSPKAKAKGEEVSLQSNQITVLGRPELDWLLAEARAIAAEAPDPKKLSETIKNRLGKEGKRNIEALAKAASGLDAAMFGRMVTSDILARGDAAVHVAHAFTVHEEQAESDYFSAVDDLLQEEEGQLGSGHINSTELTSGLYYTYLVVDLPLLVSNLEGCPRSDWESADRALAAQVIQNLIQVVATVSPGAKLGSTAPHAYAHLVMAEMGNAQPRTLANAFLRDVRTSSHAPDLLENAYRSLGQHLSELDGMYGRRLERRLSGIGPVEVIAHAAGIEKTLPLTELAAWVAQEVQGAGRPLASI